MNLTFLELANKLQEQKYTVNDKGIKELEQFNKTLLKTEESIVEILSPYLKDSDEFKSYLRVALLNLLNITQQGNELYEKIYKLYNITDNGKNLVDTAINGHDVTLNSFLEIKH
jgi:NADH:ubiquinone oxidoreductase subunit C